MGSVAQSFRIFVCTIVTFLPSAALGKYAYQPDEPVTLFVNKVAPYRNPQEKYNYYSLPFCRPPGNLPAYELDFGGNQLIDSQIEVKFKRDVDKSKICEIELDATKVKQFKDAIDNSYWFELFMDELPLWGFVGAVLPDKTRGTKHVLWTHKNLAIQYNGNRIIHVNLTQANPKSLEEGTTLEMTFSVKWSPTNVTFAHRFDIYLDYPFFENQIHWFSVFSSFLMVVFLTGLVSMILMRTLRLDYEKYAREDDLGSLEWGFSEESGWKLVRGDVFRPPQNLALLSAAVGSGVTLATTFFFVILAAIVTKLYAERASIISIFFMLYAVFTVIGGRVSCGIYLRGGGKSWIKAMILTASLFPWMCFSVGLILNAIAIFYGSLAAIPLDDMAIAFLFWSTLCVPCTFVGAEIFRMYNAADVLNTPCRVKAIPRPIPRKKWYWTPSVIALMGGLLPFVSILNELYFVFTSFWGYKIYYVFGFMLLVFVILIIVTICVTILGTYFLLNAENYHWQWTSFLSGASTALYVFLYSAYYYQAKTKMSGFFQTSFYFGYTAVFCLGLGILCGAVGYLSSDVFVRRIYSNIKCD